MSAFDILVGITQLSPSLCYEFVCESPQGSVVTIATLPTSLGRICGFAADILILFPVVSGNHIFYIEQKYLDLQIAMLIF